MVWKPGESGNPSGMPGRRPFQRAIEMECAMRDDNRLDKVPAASARAIIRKVWEKALEGDLASVIYLSERVEGKPKAIIGGDSGDPIHVQVSRGEDAAQRISQALARIASAEVVEGLATVRKLGFIRSGTAPDRSREIFTTCVRMGQRRFRRGWFYR